MKGIAALVIAVLQPAPTAPQGAPPLADPQRHPIAELFMRACFDGSVSLPSNAMRDVTRGELPAAVRKAFRFRDHENWRFIEISQPHFTYLLVRSEGGRRDYFRTVCAVAAADFDLREVYGQVRTALHGVDVAELPSGNPSSYKFANYGEGYEVSATDRPGEWFILRVGHIGEEGRRQFEAEGRRARQRFEATRPEPSRPTEPGAQAREPE